MRFAADACAVCSPLRNFTNVRILTIWPSISHISQSIKLSQIVPSECEVVGGPGRLKGEGSRLMVRASNPRGPIGRLNVNPLKLPEQSVVAVKFPLKVFVCFLRLFTFRSWFFGMLLRAV